MRGSAAAVFLGFCNDSNWILVQRDHRVASTVFSAHGSDSSSAAGRVSYLLGLKGPCWSVNTACSSSLVALDSGYTNLTSAEMRAGTGSWCEFAVARCELDRSEFVECSLSRWAMQDV